MPDLNKFKGTLPYATELRGAYQPLLGWESQISQRRVARDSLGFLSTALDSLVRDSRFFSPAAERPWNLQASLPPLVGGVLNTVTSLAAQAVNAVRNGADELSPAEWQSLFTPDTLQGMVRQALDLLPAELPGTDPTLSGQPAFGVATAGSAGAGAGGLRTEAARRYVATASLLQHLAQNKPQLLNMMFFTTQAPWETQLSYADTLGLFGSQAREEVLSPVGLLHIYRQYFYEFESFLGPAVGHVWLSPGGTVELLEVNVRKVLVERTTEQSVETMAKSETSTTTQDELSDAVKQENSDDVKMGASASGGFNVLVAHGEASASFDINVSRKNASESTHKKTRQQSEKLSSEIRRNYKTTFRTATETTDTSSRRYVLQNTTDKLVNYELRRKMRRVGVQLQHINSQLCWQFYIDDPGHDLATSALVHAAKPEDADPGMPSPETPSPLPPKEVEATIPFTLQIIDNPENNKDAPYASYYKGYYSGPRSGTDYIRMNYIERFQFAPPVGMTLARAELVSAPLTRVDANKEVPNPFVVLAPRVVPGQEEAGTFEVEVTAVNFKGQPYIPIPVKLVYQEKSSNFQDRLKEHQQKQKIYEEAKSMALRESYVKAVRERIKLAGMVQTRVYEDLREEERHVVFRRLIEALSANTGSQPPHLLSELIRRLFDLDSMMYFVAPEWWLPKKHLEYAQEMGSPITGPTALTDDDKIGWGGIKDQTRSKYLVTEESRPAPLGASLGWLLQLDGDNLRNAFLNCAWAKAVIPVRPGREKETLDWLKQHSVEGATGLSATYDWQQGEPVEFQGKTVEQVLNILADKVAAQQKASATVDQNTNALPTEVVFEHGFDPLKGGVRVDAQPFDVFDQWLEVLPTDQVVAMEYKTEGL